ncbi:MAG: flagellin [Ignavibacteria bacterium]|jgi:flagellin|nr:flagellin [Ignavibacteria bacterium]
MPFAVGGNARIRTNISAENAYNALEFSNRDISLRQLRLSTGKRINAASDDVAGYITSRSLTARNGSLKAALLTVGDGFNITNIGMDSLDNIYNLMTVIKDATAQAASGAMGTDEKIALAKAAYRQVQQIQMVCDSTVFGGRQLLDGNYSADFFVATNAKHELLTISISLEFDNPDYDIRSGYMNVNAEQTDMFAGVTGLNMNDFYEVGEDDLGFFDVDRIGTTLMSLAMAIDNINKQATYLGSIANRLTSQEDLLKGQITNYDAAISRIEDADVAKEQLQLVKSQFLQQASITSLAQANQNPQQFLKLITG